MSDWGTQTYFALKHPADWLLHRPGKWDVGEALNTQSLKGYCVTKAKADRIQRKLEAKNQVASFILVEDPVFCDSAGKSTALSMPVMKNTLSLSAQH